MARSTRFGPDIDPTQPTTNEASPGGFFNEGGAQEAQAARSSSANADDAREYAEDSRGWAVGTDSDALNAWSDTNNSRYFSQQAAASASAAAGSASAAAGSASAAAGSATAAAESARVADSEALEAAMAAIDALGFAREAGEFDSDARQWVIGVRDTEAVASRGSPTNNARYWANIARMNAENDSDTMYEFRWNPSTRTLTIVTLNKERDTEATQNIVIDDSDTMYTAGAGLNLTGTTFSIPMNGVVRSMITNSAVDTEKLDAGAVTATKLNKITTNGTAGQYLVSNGSGGFEWLTAPHDTDTTYTISFDTTSRVLTLTGSDGSTSTATIPGGTGGRIYTAGNGLQLNDDTEFAIRGGGVGTFELQDNAVTVTKLADNSVSTQSLRTGAVTTVKIVDDAITQAKLDTDSVGRDQIIGGSVNVDKLADNAVETSKINNGAVTTDKLADTSVTTAKIAGGAVTNDQIGAGAVSPPKLLAAGGNLLDGVDGQYLVSAGSNGFRWLTPPSGPGGNDSDTTYNFEWNATTRDLTITRHHSGDADSEDVINIAGGTTPAPTEHASILLNRSAPFEAQGSGATLTATFRVGPGFTYVGTGTTNGNAGNETATVNRGNLTKSSLDTDQATWSIADSDVDSEGNVTISAVIYATRGGTTFHQGASASLAVRAGWYAVRSGTQPANLAAMTNQGVWTGPQQNFDAPTGTQTLWVALPAGEQYIMLDGDLRLWTAGSGVAFASGYLLYQTNEAAAGVTYRIEEV